HHALWLDSHRQLADPGHKERYDYVGDFRRRIAGDGHYLEGVCARQGRSRRRWVDLQFDGSLGAWEERHMLGRQRIPGGVQVVDRQVESVYYVAVIADGQFYRGTLTR